MLKSVVVFLFGVVIGGLIVWKLPALGQSATKPAPKADAPNIDLTALSNDVARLKSIVPSNSHIMEDVSFHYSNLWFAGQKKNWPLATFYFNETRNHIKWLTTKSPTTKTPAGEVVNLQGIFDGLDTSSLAMLKKSIDDKNSDEFTSAYKLMLDGCYSCHKSAGRPYLHPVIPTVPPQSIITYTPDAS
ncbi:MAG: hypothetical protein JOY98_07940 [Candidatus Eremiobacteraeota bacterium]|nr:hypothetical protein [Candidatus Eremiobacteraeota bacterium]